MTLLTIAQQAPLEVEDNKFSTSNDLKTQKEHIQSLEKSRNNLLFYFLAFEFSYFPPFWLK